jgi:hypothetical protein
MNSLLSKPGAADWNQPARHLRRVVLVVLALLFAAASASPQTSADPAPQVVVHYDRFKDETSIGVSTSLESQTVDIPFVHMQEFLIMLAGVTHRGRLLTAVPSSVRLAFQSQARSWRFAEGDELLSIIDGERINLGKMSYSRQDLGAGRVETLRLDVPTHTFMKLARATTAELRIGRKDVLLNRAQLAALAALADRINGKGTPTAASTGETGQPRLPLPGVERTSPGSVAMLQPCPVQVPQLLPLRGFRLGQTLGEALARFQGTPPAVAAPDAMGIRSLNLPLARSPEERNTTGVTNLELRFLDERLYRIEATYAIGKEWRERPMQEFAMSLSRGVGIAGPWTIGGNNDFTLECGAVSLKLAVDEESFQSLPARRDAPIAVAYFTLIDTARAAQLKPKRGASR